LRNLVCIICSQHHIAEILLKLPLNTSQLIIPAPSNSFSLFQLSCATSDKIFKLFKAVNICLCLNFYVRCEASAKNKINIESEVSTFIYILVLCHNKNQKFCLFTIESRVHIYIYVICVHNFSSPGL
jgi:hypothetical protein